MSHITSFVVLLLLGLYGSASAGRLNGRFPSAASAFFGGRVEVEDDEEVTGTRWAVLIAGSNGYRNYRHQADVCHAYQMLSKGGLKDENIVVFMYDDIANDELNPRPGVIINRPDGGDVYKGVPKDYTGGNVTVNNFFAAILANRSALTGGSGKVVDSGPDDHIFIYFTDHGGPGLLGMPTEFLYAKDLIEVLGKKHASGTYKSMVFYLEACESGSIFDGLLPESWNIYATTAANPNESSWGTYCPGKVPSPPPEYDTCLGDLYSVAWLEDCDAHDLRNETLEQQYERVRTNSIVVGRLTPFKLPSDDYRRAWNEVLWVCRTKSNDYGGARNVKQRTINNNYTEGSHVMQYGDIAFSNSTLVQYMGANDTDTFEDERFSEPPVNSGVEQRDADLVHFWHKFLNAPEGSPRKAEARKQYLEAISLRKRIDEKVKLTGKLLFGLQKGPEVLNRVRPAGQPVVDDWDCLKTLVNTFETQCEPLTQYGMKHARAFANICNAGITQEQITGVFTQACGGVPIAH